jgi:ArsR family transcriptional regulator
LRALSDPTRLRIVALLEGGELSVHELQEITRMGQSRISTHLGLLQEAGLLESRREGKRTFYRIVAGGDPRVGEFIQLAVRGAKELPEQNGDQLNLKRILVRRSEQAQLYFNQVAGRFDRSYGPGRSWQAFGQLLLRALPPLVIADLGSGEGLLSELLARRAKKVIAVDNSPIQPESVDLVILSQALHHAANPKACLASSHKILRAGGQIMILDLLRHDFEQAHDLYGDRWLGFAETDLQSWLEETGFKQIEVTVVAREEQPPHFQTVLAVGEKAQ